MISLAFRTWATLFSASLVTVVAASDEPVGPPEDLRNFHREVPRDPWLEPAEGERRVAPAKIWRRGGAVSVQINVDGAGHNILGDAANEPSIAVDPANPNQMVAGWRQFDTIASDFRQAGVAYSSDGGATWTASIIEPGVFRSDPVLEVDSHGDFIYYSLFVDFSGPTTFECDTFKSLDGGATWGPEVDAFGGDKAWLSVDRTGGQGEGHVYTMSSTPNVFNRSINAAGSFEAPISMPNQPFWGITRVGPDGEAYVSGFFDSETATVIRSSNAREASATPTFDQTSTFDLGGTVSVGTGPNPSGLLGQVWLGVDTSGGPRHGHLYALASLDPPGVDQLDVFLARSTDGGVTWSTPVRVNDDPGTSAWQWFGTMSVAPNGRIDVVWNDTRNAPAGTFISELYYSWSVDGGATWQPSRAVSPAFDPQIGYPQNQKLGDYYDMRSDNRFAHVIYAATMNGEQDVYYLRLSPQDGALFADGFESGDTSAWSGAAP